MKTMTCRQLGGACDKKFRAHTFEELAELSLNHGMEMYRKGDQEHIKMMDEMRKLMNDAPAIKEWMTIMRAEFDALPED